MGCISPNGKRFRTIEINRNTVFFFALVKRYEYYTLLSIWINIEMESNRTKDSKRHQSVDGMLLKI